MKADVVIVGGGILGLAVGHTLCEQYPGRSLIILEKESQLGAHQTGHNSGVLHTGVYYKPNSFKAANCTRGKKLMEQFCQKHAVPHEICGKVIVATKDSQRKILQMIHERGTANGVTCSPISGDELREIEPHVRGVAALRVPHAGIVDYSAVASTLGLLIEQHGGILKRGTKLIGAKKVSSGTVLETTAGTIEAALVINCAGLHSDRVARLLGAAPKVKIIPFRGEYYKLQGRARQLCRHLIYPVPNPEFPFLGVHYTRMISGEVECGPNAVLAFAREGYTKTKVNLVDLAETFSYPGFYKFISKHLGMGLAEMWRSFYKGAFVKALQELIPQVSGSDLVSAAAGVRAQAITDDGKFVDDFVIEQTAGVINVLNAPSPAATSSLSLAEHIIGLVGEQVDWQRGDKAQNI